MGEEGGREKVFYNFFKKMSLKIRGNRLGLGFLLLLLLDFI